METIFMNTENSKTNEPHRFRLTLADKRNLKCTNKNMALANLSIYCTWKNIKSAYNNNELKISTSAWNDEFDLLDRSYSISDIQDYFEYIIKEHENITDNSPVQIYHNKIKVSYKLELLSPETMELLWSTKKDVDRVKDGEDVPKLESVEVVLVRCDLVNNNYQQLSKVLFTFVPAKQFRQLINISPHSLTMLNTTNTEFSSIEAGVTDQNSKPIEIEDNVDMTPIIG